MLRSLVMRALDAILPAGPPPPVATPPKRTRALDALVNMASGLGTSLDKSEATQWAPVVPQTRVDIENAIRGNWLARQIVTVPAADATREWVDHHASTPKDFCTKMKAAETRLRVREQTEEALKNARAYGGAIMLLGVADGNDPNELLEPFEVEKTKKGSLRYLRVVDRWYATGDGVIDSDIASPNFDHPEFYSIAGPSAGIRVHHSRVLRFDGDWLPKMLWWQNARWSDSVLQAADRPVKDVTAAIQAVVSMLHEANFDVVKSPMMASMLADQGDTGGAMQALQKRFSAMALLKSWMRMIVIDSEEDYETKSHSFAEIANVLEKLQVTASGAADIPFTRLYGQSPAGLTATGESDLQNYYNKISSDQETRLRPRLATLFEVVIRSEFGSYPEDYRFDFKPLWKEPSSALATTGLAIAQRDASYLQAGVVTAAQVAENLRSAKTYEISEDDIAALVEAAANAPDPYEQEAPSSFGGEPDEATTQQGEPESDDPKSALKMQDPRVEDDQERDELGRFTGVSQGAQSHADFSRQIHEKIKLAPHERDALNAWTSTGYHEIKQAQAGKLRGKDGARFAAMGAAIEGAIDRKEGAFGRTYGELHRGATLSKTAAAKLKPGASFETRTLTSWTTDHTKAEQYSKHGEGQPVVLHAADVSRSLPVGASDWEREHIVGSGQKMQVHRVEEIKGVRHVWVR